MKRVLCISHSTGLHGAEKVLLSAIRSWRDAQVEVWVAIPSILPDLGLLAELQSLVGDDHVLRLAYRAAGLSSFRTHVIRMYNYRAVRYLCQWVREKSIDTVYSNTSVTILGAQVAQRLGCRHIWHFHEPVNSMYGWTPSLRDYYRSLLKQPNTEVVFISQQQRSAWEKELDMSIKSEVIYNPIAPFQVLKPQPHNALRIGYLGNFEQRKNLDLLIRVFIQFHRNNPNSELWLCGAQNEVEKRDWSLSCPEDKGFHILLHTNDVGSFYSQIDIFALPSLSETMPLVAIEAMQSGICVLQTSESGISELYEGGKDTLFLSPDDEDAWLNALEQCADENERKRLAQNGQKKTETFDFNEQFNQQIQALLCK